MTEQLNSWRAEQQIEKEHLLARISTLELEVSKLQTELNQAQQAPKTSTPAQSETAHRPASRAAGDTTAKKAPKDALKAGEASRPKESMKQLPKKGASYADIAALLATKPGGQEWQTVPARPSKTQKMEGHRGSKEPVKEAMKARKPGSFTPVKERNKEARRLLFRREGGLAAPRAEREEVILAINRGLAKEGFPGFIRVVDMGYTATGAMTVLLEKGSLGSMLVAAARQADPAVISVELPEQWYRVKVHGVPTKRYLTRGLELAREEIELGTEFQLRRNPTWLRNPQELRERDYIVGSTDKYPCDIIRSNTLAMPDNAKLKDLPSSWVFSKLLHGYTSCTCINTAAPKAAVGTLTCPDITTKVTCPQSSGTFSCVGSGNGLIL
ncbi:hypothetical protein VTN00DRAFT_1603 [Thermoascus crustaceus]|uniref:uncharacterized protein n=1 Tax=Thermoascus crustaceus TaxID=5088 RepID=UPI0037425AFC